MSTENTYTSRPATPGCGRPVSAASVGALFAQNLPAAAEYPSRCSQNRLLSQSSGNEDRVGGAGARGFRYNRVPPPGVSGSSIVSALSLASNQSTICSRLILGL